MDNQQGAPLELYLAKITIFYKQFAPNGAILYRLLFQNNLTTK